MGGESQTRGQGPLASPWKHHWTTRQLFNNSNDDHFEQFNLYEANQTMCVKWTQFHMIVVQHVKRRMT